MIIKILILFALSFSAFGFYNPNPDGEAILLGTGNLSSYSKVYYICDTGGSDTLNNGLSPDAPYRTFEKAANIFGSLLANEAIAFCRGGKFYVNTATLQNKFYNVNATPTQRITIRDYQPVNGNKQAPKIIATVNTLGILRFDDSGNSDSDGGYIVKNLDLSSIVIDTTSEGIRLGNDADHVDIDNCYIHDIAIGINLSGSNAATNRIAATQLSDLVFAENGASADTITRGSGTWTGIIEGDTIVVTGSNSNNKTFRIDSATSTVITLTPGPNWGVVDESNTANVSVTINKADSKNTHVHIDNSLFKNDYSQGVLGFISDLGYIKNSEFYNNGFQTSNLGHAIYFSYSNDFEISGNVAANNGFYQGGNCNTAVFVGHGTVSQAIITNNYISTDESKADNGCWGIAVDNGYAQFETFNNLTITNNTLINMGSVGIGCTACVDVLIDGNVVVSSRETGISNGISVPNRSLNSQYGNPKTSNVTVTNNTVIGYGAGSLLSSNYGIFLNGTAANTEGTVTVTGNTITNWETCVKDSTTGGWTVTNSGNTKTNCTSGN